MIVRFLQLLVTALLATALAAQVETQDPEDAVKEFRRFFKKTKDEPSLVAAVMTLKGNECTPAAEELFRLLKHPMPTVQQASLAVLETYSKAETFQPWIDGMGKADTDTKVQSVRVFGQARLKAAVPAIKIALSDPKATVPLKFESARALQRIGDAATGDVLGPLLADPDPMVRLAAVDATGALRIVDLGPKVVPLLTDPEWQVQSAAITATGLLRPQSGVQPLIDLMRKAGRLRTECADALFRVTGFDFGVDPEQWQKQWDRLMAIEGWRIPTEEELAKKAESRKKYDAFYGKKEQTNTFAGIPTTSTRVLFIIDVSGSMDDLVVEREKFQGYENFKKFTVVKTELLRTLDTLTEDTYFDIVAFASDLNVWKKKLVPANLVNRDAAKSWVSRLGPIGGADQQEMAASGLTGSANLSAGKTNTLKALMYPFGIDPENPPKAAATGAPRAAIANKIDTVYFLSDGRPSVGRLVDTNEIRREVRQWNDLYRIVFHAIAIGEFQKEFLRDLATENGGVFVDLGR